MWAECCQGCRTASMKGPLALEQLFFLRSSTSRVNHPTIAFCLHPGSSSLLRPHSHFPFPPVTSATILSPTCGAAPSTRPPASSSRCRPQLQPPPARLPSPPTSAASHPPPPPSPPPRPLSCPLPSSSPLWAMAAGTAVPGSCGFSSGGWLDGSNARRTSVETRWPGR